MKDTTVTASAEQHWGFTDTILEEFYQVVDSEGFRTGDSGHMIYSHIIREGSGISFGTYLRQYLHKTEGLTWTAESIPLDTYRDILLQAFSDNGVPASFDETTCRLSALVKNWLTQQTVSRSVVFLLGFALRMPSEDVSRFLTEALHETDFNPKDPHEAVCFFCYRNGLMFAQYTRLFQYYQKLPVKRETVFSRSFQTDTVNEKLQNVKTPDELMRFIRYLKGRLPEDGALKRITARNTFLMLYEKIRSLIAEIYNQTLDEDSDIRFQALQKRISENSRLYDYEKDTEFRRLRNTNWLRQYSPEDISGADVERVFYAGIPLDKNRNLVPENSFIGNSFLKGKRLTRQRLSAILSGKQEPDRYDLITLNFFLYTQRVDEIPNPQRLYSSFCESTSAILKTCGMAPIDILQPYERMLIMCTLSFDPLSTFSDTIQELYCAENKETLH